MRREEFPELRQFFGFLYMDPKNYWDKDFRELKPVSEIHGYMIEALSASTFPLFVDLIEPFTPNEVVSIMKNAKKYGVLKYSVEKKMTISPEPTGMRYTNEVSGNVPSRSGRDIYQEVAIRKAFNEFTFQTVCSDSHFIENDWVCGIWSPVILSEWELPLDIGKYQKQPVCAHVRALDRRVYREYGSKPLGESSVDDIRPYLVAYLHGLEKYPNAQAYLFDVALTYFSPMFDNLKKRVNMKRRRAGLRDLQMYDGEIYDGVSVKQYVAWRLDRTLKSGRRRKGLPEGINDLIEVLDFEPPIELEGPSYLRPEIDILDEP